MSFARAFSPALREVRILFSQTGDASQGVRYARYRRISTSKFLTIVHRQFVVSTYPTLKKHNPDLPILIREAQGTPARAFARFGSLSTHACHAPYSENPQSEASNEMSLSMDCPPRMSPQRFPSYWDEHFVYHNVVNLLSYTTNIASIPRKLCRLLDRKI